MYLPLVDYNADVASASHMNGNAFTSLCQTSISQVRQQGDNNNAAANVSDNRRALYMLAAKNNIGSVTSFILSVLYALVIGTTAAMLQALYQAAEPTWKNKIILAAAYGSLLLNIAITILVFVYGDDKPIKKWIFVFFKITGTMPFYLGYTMLLSKRYIWIGVPIICTILPMLGCHEKIQKKLKWFFEKMTSAMKCFGRCFWSST